MKAIPVNTFSSGKDASIIYEFYNPSAVARQLAFGQLPIKLCYADVIKPREAITSGLDWDKVVQVPLMSTLRTLTYPPRCQLPSSPNHTTHGGKNGGVNYLQRLPIRISI